jgi:uncharacterized protein with HEPN domain
MNKDMRYLEFMRDKAIEAQGFVTGLSEDQFLLDNKTQSAVILKLAIIGEIAKKISPEAKKKRLTYLGRKLPASVIWLFTSICS